MPFQSEKQRRYMHANLPDIANRWEAKYGLGGIAELNAQLNDLPEYYIPKNQGGRIGYQEGELVEDEYMAEATPGGMMEENIEEVQGEPTREQLEAIALEIFRLPLEQLNEEQLEVVYQAAMEQEPAEEEVQFAAQEGPGEGIASLV